ncbi:MAG TPA: NAD-dependent epimerase/dehydratase family protein [Acidimicrobiales bacterium]|nr:NAD-dependent epimerase/dehydratase family protein [Acidimicrobiales bacterium]
MAVDMRFLVLGGTAWLGRTVAAEASGRGHQVTCLARGDSGEVASGVRFVRADRARADAYDQVAGQQWDAVVDVARQPGHVRGAVGRLEPVAAHYLFVSSGNVYVSQREVNQDESAPLLEPLESDVMDTMEDYGAAKVACESSVRAGFGPERSLIARAGLIGGPGDPSGRTGYWPWRFACPSNPAGIVVVPDAPDVPTALVDVRDLAAWLVACAESAISGVFNAGANHMLLPDHLAVARAVAGHTGQILSVPPRWLTEHGVQCWSGPTSLPLWLDDPDWYGMNSRDTSGAHAAGLRPRPLHRTLADTLTWELERPHPGPHGAGLTDQEEQALLMRGAPRSKGTPSAGPHREAVRAWARRHSVGG